MEAVFLDIVKLMPVRDNALCLRVAIWYIINMYKHANGASAI